jgi:Ca2+-binding EF-hand superfamily protein
VPPRFFTLFEFSTYLGFDHSFTFVCRKRLLAPDQVEELRALFCIYDTDGSGMIDMDELLEALPSVGYSTEEFRALFHTYDMDKNGLLDVEEFLSLMADVFQ